LKRFPGGQFRAFEFVKEDFAASNDDDDDDDDDGVFVNGAVPIDALSIC